MSTHRFKILFNTILEVVASAIRQENKIKDTQIGKEETTVLISRLHDCLCSRDLQKKQNKRKQQQQKTLKSKKQKTPRKSE